MILDNLDFIKHNLIGVEAYWIGVRATNQTWINVDDESQIVFSNWKDQEFNDSIDDYCVSVDLDGYWTPENCSAKLTFVCGIPEEDKPDISTTIIPPYTCRSYIPFSYDVSSVLSSDQFSTLRKFILNPFLQPMFPMDLQPAPFSTYADTVYSIRRLQNVTDIISYVTVEGNQVQDTASDFTK